MFFEGNYFFLPATSAASSQLVRKSQLLAANSIFIFTLSGGIILGLFAAAVTHFFFSNQVTLFICAVLLVMAASLSFLLPKLSPRTRGNHSVVKTLKEIWRAFIYILRAKVIWFFFLTFALMQGVISFGVTLAPGFFNEVVGLAINKSPIFVMPLIGLGVLLGIVFIHFFRIKESTMVNLGIGILGLATLLVSLILKMDLVYGRLSLVPVGLFLVGVGFGVIWAIVGSRTALQKNVAHNYQGTVFGANILLASFLGAVMAPTAAALEALLGYVNVLLLVGAGFLVFTLVSVGLVRRWKF